MSRMVVLLGSVWLDAIIIRDSSSEDWIIEQPWLQANRLANTDKISSRITPKLACPVADLCELLYTED